MKRGIPGFAWIQSNSIRNTSFQKPLQFLQGRKGKAMGRHSEELIRQGKEEGRLESAIQIVQRMLEKGADLDWTRDLLCIDHSEEEAREILERAMQACDKNQQE